MDDCGCSRKMTEMLIAAGHRNIAGIFKSDDMQGHWRYKGYIEGLRHAGIAICEDYIKWYNTEDLDNGCVMGDEAEFMKFMEPCTGLLCYNDQIAALASGMLNRVGLRIPEDISLVSFDDSMLSRSEGGGFTSAIHPKSMMGTEVAARLVRMIHRGVQPLSRLNLMFPVHIEVRPSIRDLNKA